MAFRRVIKIIIALIRINSTYGQTINSTINQSDDCQSLISFNQPSGCLSINYFNQPNHPANWQSLISINRPSKGHGVNLKHFPPSQEFPFYIANTRVNAVIYRSCVTEFLIENLLIIIIIIIIITITITIVIIIVIVIVAVVMMMMTTTMMMMAMMTMSMMNPDKR